MQHAYELSKTEKETVARSLSIIQDRQRFLSEFLDHVVRERDLPKPGPAGYSLTPDGLRLVGELGGAELPAAA